MAETFEQADGSITSQQKLWSERAGMVEALRRDPESFIKKLDFAKRKGCAVVCIDERVQSQKGTFKDMAFLRLAGSGILLGSDLEDSLKKAVKLLRGRVHMITWHRGCGAAAEAKRRFGLEGNVDDIAREFAEELARRLGVLCRELLLTGPLGFHNARGVIVDGTGRYRASRYMPEMFVVSWDLIGDQDIARGDVQMARDIAMGSHGFAKYFAQQPFQIVVLGRDREHLDNMLKAIYDQKIYADSVQVHDVVVPLT